MEMNQDVIIEDVSARVIHVCAVGPKQHVVARASARKYVSLVVSDNQSFVVMVHPIDWMGVSVRPLAAEIQAGDTLRPATISGATVAQTVKAVSWTPDGDYRLTCLDLDTARQVRRWLFSPEEIVDFDLISRPRRFRKRVEQLDVYPRPDGPYMTAGGVQYIFMRRPAKGGRPGKNTRYPSAADEVLRDSVTGDVMPWITNPPALPAKRNEFNPALHDSDFDAMKVSPDVLSITARRQPIVHALLKEIDREDLIILGNDAE